MQPLQEQRQAKGIVSAWLCSFLSDVAKRGDESRARDATLSRAPHLSVTPGQCSPLLNAALCLGKRCCMPAGSAAAAGCRRRLAGSSRSEAKTRSW